MKKIYYLLFCSIMAIALLSISGCQKIEEALLKDPTADYKPCNIQFMHYVSQYPSDAVFYYNKYGNPDSVRHTFVSTGFTNTDFRYDAQQRLTDYIRSYAFNKTFETWSHYIYDSNNKTITAERRYIFGTLTTASEPTTYYTFSTINITYDAQGRRVGPYDTYDAAGNKIIQGVTYDNKVNIHRTNKIWMFVDTDYSRNNPIAVDSYNRYGLPQQFSSNTKLYYSFLGRDIKGTTVKYMCD